MKRNEDNEGFEVETHGGKYALRIEKVKDPRGTYYAIFVKGVSEETGEPAEAVVPIFPLEMKSLLSFVSLITKGDFKK